MTQLVDSLAAHPKTFGLELAKLRENAGVTIEEIINETKVSRRILEALEGGKYQYLPERVFSRNFVRQYAQFVGCDVQKVVADFDASWEAFLTSSGTHPNLIVVEPPPKTLFMWRYWIPVILAALFIIVVVGFVVRGSSPDEDLTPDPRRFQSSLPTPTIFPESFSPTPVRLVADPELAVGEAIVTLEITVAEEQECWIQYRDRDGKVDSQLLLGGARLQVEVNAPALLSLGNAGAASIRVGGKKYEGLGRPGQVVHCEVSSAGLVKLGA